MAKPGILSRSFYFARMLPVALLGIVIMLLLPLFRRPFLVCLVVGCGCLGKGLFGTDEAVWGQLGMWLLGIGLAGVYLRLAEISAALNDDIGEVEDEDEDDPNDFRCHSEVIPDDNSVRNDEPDDDPGDERCGCEEIHGPSLLT